MDPAKMMEMMSQMSGGKGGFPPGMGESEQFGMQNMMQMFKEVQNDPALKKQMEGYWKMLDNMSENDPQEYDKFIKEQKKEMTDYMSQEKKQEDAKKTIQSEAYFCFSVRPSKIVLDKEADNPKDDIKLFEFNKAEISESFTENKDVGEPLDTHKLYLNIVHHAKVIPPLDKNRDIASPTDDASWQVIPIAFTEPVCRTSMSGCEVFTIDGHVNTCVYEKMKHDPANFKNILHHLVQKFQNLVKDRFLLHKGSLKLIKKSRYKPGKGGNATSPTPYILPAQHNIDTFKEIKAKVAAKAKEDQPAKLSEVKTTSSDAGGEPHITMPVPMPGSQQKPTSSGLI